MTKSMKSVPWYIQTDDQYTHTSTFLFVYTNELLTQLNSCATYSAQHSDE